MHITQQNKRIQDTYEGNKYIIIIIISNMISIYYS